jgi:hypothetical protein
MSSALLDRHGNPMGAKPELEIPGLVPSSEELDAWHREFEAEKARIERYRFKNLSQNWEGLANPLSQYVTAAAYANSAAITDVGPLPDFTIPAGLPGGQVFRITANGIYSTTGTPTLTLQLMYGGTGGTSLASSGAATTINGAANTPWQFDAVIRVLTAGTAGTCCIFGQFVGLTTVTSLAQVSATSVSINTTTANTLIMAATWGTASASNSLQVFQFLIEALN